MNKWITADWHLGEDRMQIMQRPFSSSEEMLETLIEKFNSLVKPEDEVYFVGDIIYQKSNPSNLEYVSRFNGRKILFRGNHDRIFDDFTLSKYFYEIYGEKSGKLVKIQDIDCWITHYPVLSRADTFNLVGHIHGAWKYQLNMLNVGVDVHHFYPVNFDQIPFFYKAICEFYDEDVWCAYNVANSAWKGKRGKKGSYIIGS